MIIVAITVRSGCPIGVRHACNLRRHGGVAVPGRVIVRVDNVTRQARGIILIVLQGGVVTLEVPIDFEPTRGGLAAVVKHPGFPVATGFQPFCRVGHHRNCRNERAGVDLPGHQNPFLLQQPYRRKRTVCRLCD